jgi:hypothetical protein
MAIGLDGISLKFIKLILPLILPCITHIFNTILTKSLFPKTWKISKDLPISKVKNPCSLSDYRPISIFPSLSKALEVVMKDQIMPFVIRNTSIDSNLVSALLIVRQLHYSTSPTTSVRPANAASSPSFYFLTFPRPLTASFTTSFAINSYHPSILILLLFPS